jgi:hypothetical protein
VEELVRVINSVCDALREEEMLRGKEEDACARTLRLERYMSPNFFGLFVEKEKESLLKRLSADLCQGAELRTNIHLLIIWYYRGNQCWGSGSACFWTSRIRIH